MIRSLAGCAVTIGLAFAASAALSTAPRPASPLRPLSEADQMATQEMGCTCAFVVGRDTLTQMIGHEFMLRTAAGRQTCRITDDQFSAFSDAKGAMACAGLRMTLKRTGRVRQHPEADSAEGPASLTVTQGGISRSLAGNWGCAC